MVLGAGRDLAVLLDAMVFAKPKFVAVLLLVVVLLVLVVDAMAGSVLGFS